MVAAPWLCVIRTRLRLGDLPGVEVPNLAGAATRSATVDLHHSEAGQLDRMVWRLRSDRTITSHAGLRSVGRFDVSADVRFSRWDDAGPLAILAIDEIDPTPGIDEDALAVDHGIEVLAPRLLPTRLLLSGGHYAEAEGRCPAVELAFHDPGPFNEAWWDERPRLRIRSWHVGCPPP